MKVIGLLSWFNEDCDDLRRAIQSHANYIDHLVAVDGRYARFGGGAPASSLTQMEAIIGACAGAQIGLTLWCEPQEPWPGEVTKRRHMMRLGLAEATLGTDWLWVIDADNELASAPHPDRFRAELMATQRHVCAVTFAEPGRLIDETRRPMRQLFRALPGLTVYGRHWHYAAKVDGQWEYLWGPDERQVPMHEICDVVVAHHSAERVAPRRQAALNYYRDRDADNPERTNHWWIEDEYGELQAIDEESG